MKKYQHGPIEKKWQKHWAKKKAFAVKDKASGKKNFYLLTEFPYPSGNLHVGHWYAFAMPDIFARMLRMQGKNVLYPMGFDAFGLPAENAAIKRGLNPRKWTQSNIAYMKKQMASMGASFDWSREVQTCDPAYYKWTQWLFLQFFKNGLAYKKETPVNWCPKDKTVLANEQVINGRCERCDTEVEQRNMLQWNLKITDYADRLIDDLEPLDWPKEIKESQKNWIGRSEGAEIGFDILFSGDQKPGRIAIFTTRPDTLFGATYLVLAPEHPWVTLALTHEGLLKNEKEVREYVEQTKRKSDLERQENKEKTGARLDGVWAVNPATKEKIPMYIADYVLPHYGTGAIMAVPAHDERDYEFAKKFNLPVKRVVEPLFVGTTGDAPVRPDLPFVKRNAVCVMVRNPKDDTYLCVSWKGVRMQGLVTGGVEEGEDVVEAAKREVREETGYKNLKLVSNPNIANHTQFFHRIKQQNRWARFQNVFLELLNEEREPVDEKEAALHEVVWKKKSELKGFFTVFEGDFILGLLNNPQYIHTGPGVLYNSGEYDWMPSEEARRAITEKYGIKKTTYKLRDWIVSRQRYWGVPIPIIHCNTCGDVPVPDKDLPVKLPEIKDYLPTGDGKSPLAKAEKWVKVKCPQCKAWARRETDTLDTFVDSSWYFLRYADPKNKKAFADKKKMAAWMPVDLYSGGAEHTTMHLLYSRFWHKALYDMRLVADKEPYVRRMNRGLIMGPDGQKMSKSRGNVIDPDNIVKKLGADTVRLYLAFIGPYNEAGSYPWNPDGVVGVRRFLERVWKLGQPENFKGKPAVVKELEPVLHRTIRKISDDIEALKFNTAIAQMMTLLNEAEKYGMARKQFDIFLQLLAPFAPFAAEELWQRSGRTGSVHATKWPKYDPRRLIADTVTIAIQVNGKIRGTIVASAALAEEEIKALAQRQETVAKHIFGREIKRVIYVPGRLVNIVAA